MLPLLALPKLQHCRLPQPNKQAGTQCALTVSYVLRRRRRNGGVGSWVKRASFGNQAELAHANLQPTWDTETTAVVAHRLVLGLVDWFGDPQHHREHDFQLRSKPGHRPLQ